MSSLCQDLNRAVVAAAHHRLEVKKLASELEAEKTKSLELETQLAHAKGMTPYSEF